MGAVPKHRVGPRRKAKRRTHYKIDPVKLVRCGHCEAYHRPHHVCPSCGTYRGIEIIAVED